MSKTATKVRPKRQRSVRPWRQERDRDKVVIYGLDPLMRTAFRALAIMHGKDNAQLLEWLLRTHPEVRATIRQVRQTKSGRK